MPYAQFHYPFENKELFEKNFPADFIAEGLDQTRGWFYSLLVLSVGLFDKAPFKNVIVNGMVLAEDGQKMSKKLKNYPDPQDIIDKYGVDALRYYLLSSPVVHSDSLAFSEQGVNEVVKKVIMRFLNVVSFYNLFKKELKEQKESSHPLDIWILARLKELKNEQVKGFDNYELDKATRPIASFVDDLSTWYLRRSRDRFKSEDIQDRDMAISTTKKVIIELSKSIAPIMPFTAERVYGDIGGKMESVHLESWTDKDLEKVSSEDELVLNNMKEVRRIVSLSLELRAKEGIKVRQPLAKITVKSLELKKHSDFYNLILDEINVKDIIFDETIKEEVVLDTNINSELKLEGQFRELVRAIQDLRKKLGMTPEDTIKIGVKTDKEGESLIKKFETEIKKTSLIDDITFSDIEGEESKVDDLSFVFLIEKI